MQEKRGHLGQEIWPISGEESLEQWEIYCVPRMHIVAVHSKEKDNVFLIHVRMLSLSYGEKAHQLIVVGLCGCVDFHDWKRKTIKMSIIG